MVRRLIEKIHFWVFITAIGYEIRRELKKAGRIIEIQYEKR